MFATCVVDCTVPLSRYDQLPCWLSRVFPDPDCRKLVSACFNIWSSNEILQQCYLFLSRLGLPTWGQGSLNHAVASVVILRHRGEYFGTSDELTSFWWTNVTSYIITWEFSSMTLEFYTVFNLVFNITVKAATRIPFSTMRSVALSSYRLVWYL